MRYFEVRIFDFLISRYLCLQLLYRTSHFSHQVFKTITNFAHTFLRTDSSRRYVGITCVLVPPRKTDIYQTYWRAGLRRLHRKHAAKSVTVKQLKSLACLLGTDDEVAILALTFGNGFDHVIAG